MTRPTRVEVDCATGEIKTIELTDEEIAQREVMSQAYQEQLALEQAEAQAKAEAKASALAKLQTLGLSEEEALALVE